VKPTAEAQYIPETRQAQAKITTKAHQELHQLPWPPNSAGVTRCWSLQVQLSCMALYIFMWD